MRPFAYAGAGDTATALEAIGVPGAKFLGGGTNLVDLMRLGVEAPAQLVDVAGLPLDGIEPTPDGGLRIGAAVRNSVLAADPEVRSRYAAVSQALLSEPRARSATGRPRRATSSSGRGARTSRT